MPPPLAPAPLTGAPSQAAHPSPHLPYQYGLPPRLYYPPQQPPYQPTQPTPGQPAAAMPRPAPPPPQPTMPPPHANAPPNPPPYYQPLPVLPPPQPPYQQYQDGFQGGYPYHYAPPNAPHANQQMHQLLLAQQQLMQTMASFATKPSSTANPSFPSWDGDDSTKRIWLEKVDCFQESPFFSGVTD